MDRLSNGRFKATPKGKKTKKMLEVEKQLGHTLEEDFKLYYIERGQGQKRIAQRWGVQRQLIFGHGPASKRRSWLEHLGLPKRISEPVQDNLTFPDKSCAICHDSHFPTVGAHWVARGKGGSRKRHNIVKLCRNHHDLLDRGDVEIEEKVMELLLVNEARRLSEAGFYNNTAIKQFVSNCQSIILRKP
jgi:hypothetical protein